MDNQHRQIKGYRELNQAEVDLMNRVKEVGMQLEALIEEINAFNNADAETLEKSKAAEAFRWSAMAKTDFQVACMKLTRAVAKPLFF